MDTAAMVSTAATAVLRAPPGCMIPATGWVFLMGIAMRAHASADPVPGASPTSRADPTRRGALGTLALAIAIPAIVPAIKAAIRAAGRWKPIAVLAPARRVATHRPITVPRAIMLAGPGNARIIRSRVLQPITPHR